MRTLPTLFLTAALAMPVTFGQAQEFSSRGTLSAEANWTSLNNLIGRNKGEIDIVKIKMEAMQACSAKGMLHAPNATDKDENGCVAISKPTMACTVRSATRTLTGNVSQALCAADEVLTGGGGEAEVPSSTLCSGSRRGFIHNSRPDGNSWIVDAYQDNWAGEACTQAYAICCKIVN